MNETKGVCGGMQTASFILYWLHVHVLLWYTCTLYGVPYLQNTSNIKMIRSICLSLLASLVLRVSQAFVHCTDPVCINFIATSYLYEQSSLDNELILLTFAKYLLQKSDWSSIMMAAL